MEYVLVFRPEARGELDSAYKMRSQVSISHLHLLEKCDRTKIRQVIIELA